MLRSILGIGGAAVAGQMVALACAPILTRLYDAGDLGVLGVFLAVSAILGAVPPAGIHEAIITPRNEEVARSLFCAGNLASVILSFPLVIGVAGVMGVGSFGLGSFTGWVPIAIYINLAAIGATMTLQGWLVRGREWRSLARLNFFQSVTRPMLQIALGVIGFGFAGLIIAEVATRVLLLAGFYWSRRDCIFKLIQETKPAAIRESVWDHRSFVWSRTVSSLLNNVGTMMINPLIVARYGLEAGGLYTLTEAMLNAPLGLIYRSIGDVFLGHFAALHRQKGAASRLFWSTAGALFLISAVFVAGLVFFGPLAFALAFGDKWREAGVLAALMSPAAGARLIVAPISGVLNVVNRPELKLLFDFAQIGAILMTFQYSRSANLDLHTTLLMASLFIAVAYALYFVLLLLGLRRPRPLSVERRADESN